MDALKIKTRLAQVESDLASLEGSFGNPRVAANQQAMKELKGKYEQGKRDLAELMSAWEAKAQT